MTGRKGANPPWLELTRAREAQGLSKAKLARMADMNASHVSSLENGYVRPRIGSTTALAKALGVAVSTLQPPSPTDTDALREMVRVEVAKALGDVDARIAAAVAEQLGKVSE